MWKTSAGCGPRQFRPLLYDEIEREVKPGGRFTIARMCALAGVSRAGFSRCALAPRAQEVPLRDEMQGVALAWPTYGSRRITAELRRAGWVVNGKRVQRLMRADNLLCLRRRKFVVTTDAAHGWRVYPNLATRQGVSGINQLWLADITYIRLLEEFIDLAVILDAFSRRAIGWAVDHQLETSLTLSALTMALEQRRPAAGLVHHSDRGVQYASQDCGSAISWIRSTTRNGCTRRSAIAHRRSSSACSCLRPRRWSRWRRGYEFSEA